MWRRTVLSRIFLIALTSVLLLAQSGMLRGIGAGAALQSAESNATDWPMLMHDALRSGYTSASLVPLSRRLHVLWKVGLGERVEVQVQPIVAYGKVYVGVMNGKFYAINATTGEIEWVFQAGGAIPHTAMAANDKVYFGCEDGKVYAVDAFTGALVWTYQTGGPVISSPLVSETTLYVGSFDTFFYALNAATGTLQWRYQTEGRVWTSPAMAHEKVYFGSEDMYGYCLDTVNGDLLWRQKLSGVSMRNTYPVLGEGVVIFTTVKPGEESYMPNENFELIQGLTPEEVVAFWNDWYKQFPDRRNLYYLDAETGEDKWDPIRRRFVPFPLPYWGLIVPLVDADGFAWFPASGCGGDHALDHNFRLWKVNLVDGITYQAGSQQEYMMQPDETGTHSIAGYMYYQTGASNNVGMFDPLTRQKYHIFGDFWWPGDGEPLDPTPTIHKQRYAGSGWAIWESDTSSPLVVANGVGYYIAYSWLYALVPQEVTEPHVVNMGTDLMTSPAKLGRSYQDFIEELNERVEQIIVAGHLDPEPIFWGWIGETIHPLWLEGEIIASLAQTMPYLYPETQEALRTYLRTEVTQQILNYQYEYRTRCMVYGYGDVIDPCDLAERPEEIRFHWFADDPNVMAEHLYALWAYAHYTGDWQLIADHWAQIVALYHRWVLDFDPSLGFILVRDSNGVAKRWHSPHLRLNLQIAAMLSVARMADRVGDTGVRDQANDLLTQMYDARLMLGRKVQTLYDQGVFHPVTGYDALEIYEVMPYQGYRDRNTDVRKVFWTDGSRWEIFSYFGQSGGTTPGIVTNNLSAYADLIGYRPMFPELGDFLAQYLKRETEQYVHTMEMLNPWWYWNDVAHPSQYSGENLYCLPHFSTAMFQAKAYVLGLDFEALRDQLPWEYTAAGFRDIYRLQNLVALLQAESPSTKSVSSVTADHGDVLTYTISLQSTGATATITDTIPAGTTYVSNSAHIEPQIGTLTADSNLIHWTGVLTEYASLELTFAVTVTVTEPFAIVNTAIVDNGEENRELTATTIANGLKSYFPTVMQGW